MKQLIVILSLVITACAPTTQFPDVNKDLSAHEAEIQRDVALKEIHKYFTRLQDVSATIFMANAEICPNNKVRPFYGFHANNLDAYDKKLRDAAARVHGLQSQPTVYYVSPGTPAHGKFQKGDVITRVDDKKIPAGKNGNKKLAEYIYNKDRLNEPISFMIERDEASHIVVVKPVISCGGQAILSDQRSVHGVTDGSNILITRQMMNRAKKDEELALIIGYELAPKPRNYIESKQSNITVGVVFGAAVSVATGISVNLLGGGSEGSTFSKDFEAEADYVGLYYVARAGYDIDNAVSFWRRMAVENSEGVIADRQDNPKNYYRFIALEKTVKEINAKKEKGSPLFPEEKSAEVWGREIGKLNE